MKTKIFLFFIVFSLIRVVTFGQRIIEEPRSMSLGTNNALSIMIKDIDAKLVEKEWKKYLKDFGAKVKRNRKEDEFFCVDADIPAIGQGDYVNVYARFEDFDEKVNVIVWFDLGEEIFLTSEDKIGRYDSAEDFLIDFYHGVVREKLALKIKSKEKELKKLNSELSKLEKNNKRYHDKIEAAKKEIKENEDNISQNMKEQETTRKSIKHQKELLGEKKDELTNWTNDFKEIKEKLKKKETKEKDKD